MTTAPALFTHAVRMILHDPATTLRVLMPGILLIIASSFGIAHFMPEALLSPVITPDQMQDISAADAGAMLLSGLAGIAGYVVLAVFWHRHVLLMGDARETALFPGMGVMGGYLWRVILVALIQTAAALPIVAVSGIVATVAPVVFAGLVASVLFFWIALRVSLILPAAAMGRALKIGESWEATAPMSAQIWGLALILGVLSSIFAIVLGQLGSAQSTAGLWFQTLSFLVEGLISVSILTTLYGHLVEGRPLG